MGAWGPGGFENDTALDFAGTLTSVEGIADVFAQLPDDPVAEIEADLAETIIAAAECVAAMMGRPGGDLPDEVAKKVSGLGEAGPDLVEAAREAVSRVLAGSELVDLWAEDDAEPWNIEITSLIDRLNPALSFKPTTKKKAPAVLQICSFCDQEIAEEELVMFRLHKETDIINVLDRGFWCHLKCLNGKLHPRHLIQDWKFDPDKL